MAASLPVVDGMQGAGVIPFTSRDCGSNRRRCTKEVVVLMHRMLEGKKVNYYVDCGGGAMVDVDKTRRDIAAREFSEETNACVYKLAESCRNDADAASSCCTTANTSTSTSTSTSADSMELQTSNNDTAAVEPSSTDIATSNVDIARSIAWYDVQ
jgi:hypothetical protein